MQFDFEPTAKSSEPAERAIDRVWPGSKQVQRAKSKERYKKRSAETRKGGKGRSHRQFLTKSPELVFYRLENTVRKPSLS